MAKVYVVTEGSYSDKQVVAVFSDRAMADAFASGIRNGNVLTLDLDVGVAQIADGLFRFCVDLDLDREQTYVQRSGELEYEQSPYDDERWYVWARDEKHAVKIAADKYRMFLTQPKAVDA